MEKKAGTLIWLLSMATGCATRVTTPQHASTELAAAPAPSARIFESGSGRIASVSQALAFRDDVMRGRRGSSTPHAERVEERTDRDGNHVRSRIREFEDGSVALEQETFDPSGLLIRFKACDDDGATGTRSGFRIEHPETGFRPDTTARDLAQLPTP